MLLSEFIKDFGVKKYFRTPKNIKFSLLANFIQLVLEGDWIGKLSIPNDFSQNADILEYFRVLDPVAEPTKDALRFGDVYIILSPRRYRYGVFLNSNAVIEQPNHLDPQHVVLKDNIDEFIDWSKDQGYEVVLLRPLNEKNIFPSDDLRYIKQDKPFAHAYLNEETSSYIVTAPGNHVTYTDPIWEQDPTNKQIEILAKQEIYRPLWLHILDSENNTVQAYEGVHDGEFFSTWSIPESEMPDDQHMLALIRRETNDFTTGDIKWTGNTPHDELFRKDDVTVTVGASGDYTTVNKAIHALSHLKPDVAYTKDGFTATINLLTGFTMAEQVLIKNQDLSWITITSVDAEVPVTQASITEIVQKDVAVYEGEVVPGVPLYTDDLIPILSADNAKAPVIDVLFAYPNDGDGYCATAKDGFASINGGHITFKPGSGAKRARSGLKVLYNASASCYVPGLTQGGAGLGGGDITGADFSYCQRIAVHVAYNSTVDLPRTIARYCKGEYGFYNIWGAKSDFYQSQVDHTINGYACTSRDGSMTNMRDTDVSYSVRGYHALHNGRINARRSAVLWSENSAKNCTDYGVLASNNSHIDAANVDVSGCLNRGVHASDASSIAFNDGAKAQNCTIAGVGAVMASTVDASGADVSGSGIGFDAQNGSTINAQETIANDCVAIVDVDISGVAYRAQQQSTIQAYNGQADDCAKYGVYADRGSSVNCRGGTFQNAGVYGIGAVEGARINARTTNCNGAGTFGYYIDRGSFIVIGEPSSQSVNGTFNQTINMYSGLGAILNDNLPTPIDPTLAGGVIYRGTFNATTNTPTLVNGTGHTGDMYRVTVAGTHDFGTGNIELAIGDYVIYNGSVWEKIDNTDQVTSVFGRQGAVVAAGGDYTATQVTNAPAGNIAATTVQAAINELDTEKEPLIGYTPADDSLVAHLAGTETFTGKKTFAPTNATDALKVSNSSLVTDILRVDTSNGRVGINFGTATALNATLAINGNSVLGGGSTTPTARADIQASTTSVAAMRIRSGVAPTAPNDGEFWYDGTDIKLRLASVSETIAVRSKTSQQLFDHYANVGNSGTSETDLYSDTTIANQLSANGQKIIAEYGGTFVSSGTATRQVKVYFGGTSIFDTGALTLSLSSAWTINVTLIRVSSTIIRYKVDFQTQGASSSYTSVGELTGLTLSSTNILKITGTAAGVGAATDDIVAMLGTVSWKPQV